LFILITGKWKEKGRGHVTAGRQTGHLFNAISPFYEKVKYELSKAHNTFTRKDRQTFLMSICVWHYVMVWVWPTVMTKSFSEEFLVVFYVNLLLNNQFAAFQRMVAMYIFLKA